MGHCSAQILSSSNAIETYNQMQQWKLADTVVSVPVGGLVLEADSGKWTLKSGVIRVLEPQISGIVTGLVFEGDGFFEMEIPDPVEKSQLERFTDGKLKDRINEPFTQLLIRDSGNRLTQFSYGEAAGSMILPKLVKNRHEIYLKAGFLDIDARVLMGVINQDDPFLMVDTKTNNFGWLTYINDQNRGEEVQLIQFDTHKNTYDTWISLDRQIDRMDSGRPSRLYSSTIDITQVDISVDLTDFGWQRTYSSNAPRIKTDAKMTTLIKFSPLESGMSAIEFGLNATAKVTGVKSVDGTEIKHLRDHIGGRFLGINDETYDDSLTVFFKVPLSEGNEYALQFEYEMEIKNFASGRSWYPSGPGGFQDKHTVKFEATMNKKFDIFAVGRKTEEMILDKKKISTWETTSPTAMYGFTYGKNFKQESIKLEEMPEIVCFGTKSGFTTGNMIRNVAADVANSMKFYLWFLDETLTDEPIYVTYIDAWHGQAFEGLIHLSKYTFRGEHAGESELFRSHETAHQFWGHEVGFSTYRDQWISEAFAEYFAMLFLETTMDDPCYFRDSLKDHAWHQMFFTGRVDKIGPIDVGQRAQTTEVPKGYYIQAYQKGPMVLHMIRVILRNATNSEDTFRDVVQTFYKTYKGKNATTEGLKKILEEKTQSDWSWFFKQWIDNSYYPTYKWSWDVANKNNDNNYPLTVTVDQSDVPDDFRMIVPLLIEYKNGKISRLPLPIDKPQNTFTFKLKHKPAKLTLNPDWAVLATVIKR